MQSRSKCKNAGMCRAGMNAGSFTGMCRAGLILLGVDAANRNVVVYAWMYRLICKQGGVRKMWKAEYRDDYRAES